VVHLSISHIRRTGSALNSLWFDSDGNLNYRTNNALVQTFNVSDLNELTTGTWAGTLTVASAKKWDAPPARRGPEFGLSAAGSRA
jgi:hypothetical protein